MISRVAAGLRSWYRDLRPERGTIGKEALAGVPGAIGSVPDGMAAAVLAPPPVRPPWPPVQRSPAWTPAQRPFQRAGHLVEGGPLVMVPASARLGASTEAAVDEAQAWIASHDRDERAGENDHGAPTHER